MQQSGVPPTERIIGSRVAPLLQQGSDMVSTARWQRAQQYERGYWASLATRIADGSTSQLDWYRWRAEQLVLRLRALGLERLVNRGARVIEVGCGPVGVAAFFPAAERMAVDPLERTTPPTPLAALRDPAVDYREGSVEALPCESGHYDLAIIENCIDHVRDMHAGMRELQRALRTGGALYLTVNCRTKWGFVIGDRDPDRIPEYVQEREDALDGAVAMLDRAWAVPTPEGEPETVTKPSPAPEGENWASESDRGAESWEAPEAGLEPATRRLTAGCSTN